MQLNPAQDPAQVYQTDFTPGTGNALQACVASIFHLPLDEVPNFVALPCGYEHGIQEFVAPRGYVCRKVPVAADVSTIRRSRPASGGLPESEAKKTRLCILRGTSPRGDFGHVVVALLNEQVSAAEITSTWFDWRWDPHPQGGYLNTQHKFGWYMVFDPV